MFFHGTNKELTDSIEAIGAGFAVYEYVPENGGFNLVSCNTLYEEILGRHRNDCLGQELFAVFPRYVSQPMADAFLKCKSEQVGLESEILIEYKGDQRYWRSIISPILAAKNGKLRIIQTCVEITEKKVLERKLTLSMKRFEAVVQSAYDGIITIDGNQNIKLFNEAARQIFGYGNDELIGGPVTKLLPQKYRKSHVGYVEGFRNSPVDSRPMQTRSAVRGLRKDGTEFPIEVTISKINVEGNTEFTAVIRDISEKNKLLEELLVASRQDYLTGLFNRRHFSELLRLELLRYLRFKRPFCLLMLDVDHFKEINDTYGHESGDRALVQLSGVLSKTVRETDTIGRWGGEEFMVLLAETKLAYGLEVAEKIRRNVEAMKVDAQTTKFGLTVSIGVQEYADEHENLDELINSVDKCLYFAKTNGRNKVSNLN